MDKKYFDEIKAREQAATPGPWHWEIATANKSVCLENGRDKIMDFARYGMDGAAPRFNVDGIMERADKLAKSIPGMEHHVGFDDYIDNSDSCFIAHARADIPTLIEQHERDEKQIATLKKALEKLSLDYCMDTQILKSNEEIYAEYIHQAQQLTHETHGTLGSEGEK